MQFKAYQHYFHQRPRDSVGNIATSGNQGRRGYRPVTAAHSSKGGQSSNHVTLNFGADTGTQSKRAVSRKTPSSTTVAGAKTKLTQRASV